MEGGELRMKIEAQGSSSVTWVIGSVFYKDAQGSGLIIQDCGLLTKLWLRGFGFWICIHRH